MKKSKLLVGLFIFLTALSGWFLGMLLSRFFIPKSAGLVGAAMVFWYGLLGLFIGLLGAIIARKYINAKQLKWINGGLGLFVLFFVVWIGIRINAQRSPGDPIPRQPTQTIENQRF